MFSTGTDNKVFLDMGINKIVIGTTVGLLLLVALIYTVAEKEIADPAETTSVVEIEETWELPKVLSEISGITFIEGDRVLGVQDERGSLFVYNLETKNIDQEIAFGESGDYEGVTVWGTTAFVLKSDGNMIEIKDYLSSPVISMISTPLTAKADTESLCLDEKNKRLFIVPKEEDPTGKDYKGIYAVSLSTMEMDETPVYKINFNDPVFKKIIEDDLMDTFKPSEINIHPSSGEIFVLDGANSQLLLLDKKGTPRQLIALDKTDFPQAEGLSFDASGNMYISNEGSPGTIHRVVIN